MIDKDKLSGQLMKGYRFLSYWSNLVILALVLCNCFFSQSIASAHKTGSAVNRYGDVIIIRHADGTIESRDASGPTYHSDNGAPIEHKSIPSKRSPVTKNGGNATTRVNASSNANSIALKSKKTLQSGSMSKISTTQKHSSSHYVSPNHKDDVIIIRNPDGSIEARDAH